MRVKKVCKILHWFVFYRCEHTMKELEYYRGQHIAVMSQLEATSQESSALREKYGELANDKQRLDREVQALQKEVSELRCQNQEVLVADVGNNEAISQHYRSALHEKYQAIKDDYENLRKRYEDLIASHSSAVNKVTRNFIYKMLRLIEIALKKKIIFNLTNSRNSG